PASQLGAASSNVNFFRTIAGTIGVTIMGSLLATQVTTHITSGLKGFTPTSPEEVEALKGLAGGGIPHVSQPPDGIRVIIENAYGNGIADVFWLAVPLAVLSVIAIAFLPNKALSTKTSAEQLKEEFEQVAIDLAEAEIGAPVTSSMQLVDGEAATEGTAKTTAGSRGAADASSTGGDR
ncbi:MAG: MFS transporter, partial [Agromyces sp.]